MNYYLAPDGYGWWRVDSNMHGWFTPWPAKGGTGYEDDWCNLTAGWRAKRRRCVGLYIRLRAGRVE